MQKRFGLHLACLFLILPLSLHAEEAPIPTPDALARGDAAWAARGSAATADVVTDAIDAYSQALTADASDFRARRKLLQALYFQGEHAVPKEKSLEVFLRGRDLAEEGIDLLAAETVGRKALDDMSPAEVAATLGKDGDRAATIFWAAAHWGLWGRERGKIASAKEGVAGKIRRYALITQAMNPSIQDAGGHRILGRLHTEAPKIPFFTGWIDRDRAVTELELALQMAPTEPLNGLYLAEALLQFQTKRRSEAEAILEDLVGRQPRADFLVEDSKAIADARALLE